MIRRWSLAVLLLISGCGSLAPAKDAIAPSLGAGIGAFFSPLLALLGALFGSVYTDAVDWGSTKKLAIKTVYMPPTGESLWDAWGSVLVGILVCAFLFGWILNKPTDMLKGKKPK